MLRLRNDDLDLNLSSTVLEDKRPGHAGSRPAGVLIHLFPAEEL